MNKHHQKSVLEKLSDGSLSHKTYIKLSPENFVIAQTFLTKIVEWVGDAPIGSSLLLDISECTSDVTQFLVIVIPKRHANLWVFMEGDILKVKRISSQERKILEETVSVEGRDSKKFQSLLGFSKVMNVITDMKKPIVGHNIFTDLLLVYNLFIEPLPSTYAGFKASMNKYFPIVYDTKTLSFEFRSLTKRKDLWKTNALDDLYKFFKNCGNAPLAVSPPNIVVSDEFAAKTHNFHNAGYDSFCTGFCFLRLSHLYYTWNSETNSFATTFLPFTISSLLASVKMHENHVNVMRAHVNYISLSGPDPVTERPPFLHLESKGFKEVNFKKVCIFCLEVKLVRLVC